MRNVLVHLFTLVLEMLKPEHVQIVIGKAIDAVEDLVKESHTKIDDILVLPLCKKIREGLGIPDNDKPDEPAPEVPEK
jgi:hypothetical protein